MYKLQELPLQVDVETTSVLKKAIEAHRYLAELKGLSQTIPNQEILINTLSLQEAKDSSAIENIITTHDDLFKENAFKNFSGSIAAKEVHNYADAIKTGYELIKKDRLITNNKILQIQEVLEKNKAGFRKLPGTELKNDLTGQTIYTPPQDEQSIIQLMSNLEKYINKDSLDSTDPLIKMAIIHHQFESIHPFYDGNGRTGRILNVLYLVAKGLLDIPVLYLSRYIIRNKDSYYQKLQAVRDTGNWESWILYILQAIVETSISTIQTIKEIDQAFETYRTTIQTECKFYSYELINNLFYHPYTKIEHLEKSLSITRITAAKYLDTLDELDLLEKRKIGRSNYFINKALFKILTEEN